VDELTLHLVEEVVTSQLPPSVPHPIRDELLPRLGQARTLEDAELAIHDAARVLGWLGDALVGEPDGQQLARKVLERTVPLMLLTQDSIEQVVDAAAGAITARKTIVAHETLRRFLMIGLRAAKPGPPLPRAELPPAALPTMKYMSEVALRLALLVVAIEHLAPQRVPLLSALAQRAFETSQTFRRATREMGIDLTPWADAPAATRAKRILEAAKVFWNSLNTEQRRAVDEAWGERVELLPRWPLPSS
jgi:hypothetical protein